jgi:sec-independent protein translocase protein TatB
MFGIGGSEIIVILVVALLFLGPDKLPDAAKTISKGIRDLKKQSRALQQQIESDEQIGGAIRDLKSALRDEPAPRPPPALRNPPRTPPAALDAAPGPEDMPALEAGAPEEAAPAGAAALTLPATAGEADPDVETADDSGDEGLAAMIKPATGTVAKGEPAEPTDRKHG